MRHARVAALAGALCIAFSGIFFRLSGVTPETGTVFRCLYALPILAIFALAERRRDGPAGRSAHLVGVAAGVFFAADLLTWHHAIVEVGAGLATVLANMQVVVVALVAWVVLSERPSRGVAAAIPIMLAGVVLISGVVGGGAYGADPRLGVVFGTVAALSYAGYLLLVRHGNREGLRAATLLFDASATTAAVAALVGTVTGAFDPVPSWPAHGWLVLVALTSQVAGYLLISFSLPRLPAALTSVILLAQPITTVVVGGLVLGEAPSVFQLGGVGLILAGLAVANIGRGARPRARRTGIPETEGVVSSGG